MKTHIQKWGNSLALRIPRPFAAEVKLEQDTLVELSVSDGRLVITPVQPACTLDQLLAGVTDENVHAEQDFGAAVGREIWD
jgi:antitoxin MazE